MRKKNRKEEHQRVCGKCETCKILKERSLEGWCESFAVKELYTGETRRIYSYEGYIDKHNRVINKFTQEDFKSWCPFYFEHLTITTFKDNESF